MSSSAYGGTGSTLTGGSSTFIENYVADPVNWIQYTANGGQDNNADDSGGDNDDFTGGNGITAGGSLVGGGGGAGSTSNGGNAYVTPGTPNSRTGGNGGSGSFIESKFIVSQNDLTEYVAIGGPGSGDINGQFPHGDADALGNGGNSNAGGNDNGNDGTAILFVPISTCSLTPTGSIILPDEQITPNAIGGDITGTFTSASRDYKYHLFTGGTDILNFNQGFTDEAKILLVGGGAHGGTSTHAGGGGAGGVAIKRNQTLYGSFQVTTGVTGSSAQTRGGDSVFTSKSNYIYKVRAIGGGRGASSALDGQDGGSGGGGYKIPLPKTSPPGDAINCTDTSFCTADEYFGNNGGDGAVVGSTGYGGGGGGAGSVGETGGTTTGLGGSGYTLTTEFFPPSVLFSSSSIARGGSRDGLYQGYQPEANSGDGAGEQTRAQKGFVCVTYPIS